MSRYTFLAARLVLSFMTVAQAQSPAVELGAANDGQLESTIIPSQTVTVSEETNLVQLSQSPNPCQSRAAYMHCGSPTQQMSCRERFQYYRGVRQSYERGPCCHGAAAGFGALWNTYCSDRQGCCAQPGSAPGCRGCGRRRSAAFGRRTHSYCDACSSSFEPVDGGHAVLETPAGGRLDIGTPPAAPEAESPATDSSQADTPDESKQARSGRRIWRRQTGGSLAR